MFRRNCIVLSPLIKIDEFATENESRYLHLFTRPVVQRSLRRNWNGSVCASPMIRDVLYGTRTLVRNAVPIKKLIDFGCTKVALSDGSVLKIVWLPTETHEHHGMLLLELGEQVVFYTGDFTEFRSVLRSSWLQIDRPADSPLQLCCAFVDNASQSDHRSLSVREICEAIVRILKRHQLAGGKRLRLALPEIGAEDVLHALVDEPFGQRLFVNSVRIHMACTEAARERFTKDRTAAIHVDIDRPMDTDDYEQLRRSGTISVRFMAAGAKTTNERFHPELGLYELNYFAHAHPMDVLELIEALRAKRFVGIYTHLKTSDTESQDVGLAGYNRQKSLDKPNSQPMADILAKMAFNKKFQHMTEENRMNCLAIFGEEFFLADPDQTTSQEMSVGE